jgi:SAM-dependent methyltransferase
MPALDLPLDDEPVDFRHQAATYGRFRRDYSTALYDAIEARTGAGAGRLALDVGCGTGFVTASLAARGWRAIGVDFSVPMLAAARTASPDAVSFGVARRRCPSSAGRASLVTVGTAFHWMAPAPTVAEIARVLMPGGWCAIFWRLSIRESPPMKVLGEVLARIGIVIPDGLLASLAVPDVFQGSELVAEPVRSSRRRSTTTVDDFLGAVATFEMVPSLHGIAAGPVLDSSPTRYGDGSPTASATRARKR